MADSLPKGFTRVHPHSAEGLALRGLAPRPSGFHCLSCQEQMARVETGENHGVLICTNPHCPKGIASGKTFSVGPALPCADPVSRETPPSAPNGTHPVHHPLNVPGAWDRRRGGRAFAEALIAEQASPPGAGAESPVAHALRLARASSFDDPEEQRHQLEEIGRLLLATLGIPESEATRETPARWARWWQEFLGYRDANTETAFASASTDQMVVVRGVRVWSLCEHHLLPFFCDVTMAYIPAGKILGLSKFGRIAHLHAHKLQVQERLVTEIADHLAEVTGAPDLAVLGDGEHLCMTMRGIRAGGHRMSSSVLRGVFRTDDAARQEFFHLASAEPR